MTTMTTKAASLALTVALVFGITVPADRPDQCDQPTYAAANPGLCQSAGPFGFGGSPPPTGGGPRGPGGLAGLIHHLTGGLL